MGMVGSATSKTGAASVVTITALVVASLSGCSNSGHTTSGPTPTHTTSSTPLAATRPVLAKTHTSRLLQYQMSYPAGWTLKSATRPWRFGGPGGERGDSNVDEYDSPGPSAIVVASQKLPTGMTGLQWLHAYDDNADAGACWPPIAQWPTTKIAGHTAWMHGGLSYCNFIEAVTVVNGRAYVFTGSASTQCCHRFDQGTFSTFLTTVKFPGDGSA
jgi:hypothetical protein